MPIQDYFPADLAPMFQDLGEAVTYHHSTLGDLPLVVVVRRGGVESRDEAARANAQAVTVLVRKATNTTVGLPSVSRNDEVTLDFTLSGTATRGRVTWHETNHAIHRLEVTE